MGFKIEHMYRFRSNESMIEFEKLFRTNRKITAAMAGAGDYFTVLKLSSVGSIMSIRMANGKIITSGDLDHEGTEIDIVISYDEEAFFEEVKLTIADVEKDDEKKYDVMTAHISGGSGFLIRHIGVSYKEAERWASEYVKENDDEYAYIIQRFAKVELKMEPSIKIEKL